MTNANQNSSRYIRSRLQRAGRVALLILPLGCVLPGAGVHPAQAAGPACTTALDQLMSQWQAIGFAEPSKPTQQVVAGRHGYTTSGGQFNYLRQQIRVASQYCEGGRDAEALQHIDTVRGILDHLGHI
jgi:hypothetical protein